MYAVVTVFHKDNKDDIDTLLISDLMVGVKLLQTFQKDVERIYRNEIKTRYENVDEIKTLTEARRVLKEYTQKIHVYLEFDAGVFYEKFIVDANPIDVKGGDKYVVTELTHDGYDTVEVWRTNDIKKAVKQIKDNHSIFIKDTNVHKTNMRKLDMKDLNHEFEWADNMFYLEDRYEDYWYVGRIFMAEKLYV